MSAISSARVLIDDLAASSRMAARLARYVALAVRVEPELLRAARLSLIPCATAADEADLWFSSLVEAEGAFGITLMAEVRELLRLELASEQPELDRAWALLEKVHRSPPPTIRIEERVTYLALSERPDQRAEIARELYAVARAMGDARRHGLARWAARALPTLPAPARDSDAAWTLAVGAGAWLGGRNILGSQPPDSLAPEALTWALPPDGPRCKVAVRLRDGSVEFGPATASDVHVIELPMPEPLLVRVSWLQEGEVRSERVLVRSSSSTGVPAATEGGLLITSASGRRYVLRPRVETARAPMVYISHRRVDLVEGPESTDDRMNELLDVL